MTIEDALKESQTQNVGCEYCEYYDPNGGEYLEDCCNMNVQDIPHCFMFEIKKEYLVEGDLNHEHE